MLVTMLLTSTVATKDTDLNQKVRDEVEAMVCRCGHGHCRSQSQGGGDCNYCGSKHPSRKCPVYGQTCNNCDGKNHYSHICKSRARSQKSKPWQSKGSTK